MPDDAVCRVIGGVLWHRRFERAAHFHAPEDAEDPILIPPLHPLQVGPDGFLFADPLLWIQHRDLVVSSVAFHPSPVLRRALCQDLRRDRIYPVHVAEKMRDVFGPGQQRQVPLDDDAVETVIYKNQEAFKKLREDFHRSPPPQRFLTRQQDHLSGDRWNQPGPERSMVLCVLATWRETKEGWYDRERHCQGNRRRRLSHSYDARPGLAGI